MADVNRRSETEEKIIKKAWEDADFKKALLENPKAAIQKALEIVIPDNIEVKVVEETLNTMYLILPVSPAEVTAISETDEEIEPQTVY